MALCAVAGCQRGGAMTVCRKAEKAGILAKCRVHGGVTAGAMEAIEADDAQIDGKSQVIITEYASDPLYTAAMLKTSHKNALCVHGNARKKIIVEAYAPAFDNVCRAVYEIVDAN